MAKVRSGAGKVSARVDFATMRVDLRKLFARRKGTDALRSRRHRLSQLFRLDGNEDWNRRRNFVYFREIALVHGEAYAVA